MQVSLRSGPARAHLIATTLDSKRMRREGRGWTAQVRLDAPSVRGKDDGLAVWVVGPDGRPVQAAGGR
jgi:hypothetical protein